MIGKAQSAELSCTWSGLVFFFFLDKMYCNYTPANCVWGVYCFDVLSVHPSSLKLVV